MLLLILLILRMTETVRIVTRRRKIVELNRFVRRRVLNMEIVISVINAICVRSV